MAAGTSQCCEVRKNAPKVEAQVKGTATTQSQPCSLLDSSNMLTWPLCTVLGGFHVHLESGNCKGQQRQASSSLPNDQKSLFHVKRVLRYDKVEAVLFSRLRTDRQGYTHPQAA